MASIRQSVNLPKKLSYIGEDLERANKLCDDLEKELEAQRKDIVEVQQASASGKK